MYDRDPLCSLEDCGKKATILDTEYDEYFCAEHADEFDVLAGPYKELKNDE